MKSEDKHAVHISGDQEVHIIPIEEEVIDGDDNFGGTSGPTIKQQS